MVISSVTGERWAFAPCEMAEVAVSPRMFADILSLIARLRAPPAPALLGDRADTTDDDGRRCALMNGKTGHSSAVARSTGSFDHLLRTRSAI